MTLKVFRRAVIGEEDADRSWCCIAEVDDDAYGL
jgi:hypothetical protein